MRPIPSTPVGAQLDWLLEAVKTLPIEPDDFKQHVSASVLALIPAEQLNALLTAQGDIATAHYVGLLASTNTSLDGVIGHELGRLSVIKISVDNAGLINDLQFTLMPLRPRAELGLPPVALPAATGPSNVGTDTIVTTGDSSGGRKIPAQLWYPADPTGHERSAPYAPPATQSSLAEQLAVPREDIASLQTGATIAPPVNHDRGALPIIILAPGLGVARTYYSALGIELASHGYLVAVLDRPGGSNPVEYPDGTAAPAAAPTSLDVPAEIAIRIADADAVVDLLTQLNTTPGSPFRDALDLGHIAFTGHSIGGAAAAEAMRLDERYDIGANLDGSMSGEVLRSGLDRPFLLMGSNEEDESWDAFRSASSATASVRIDGVAHMSFSDLPALSVLRLAGDVEQIGTLDPMRSIAIERAYLLAFLDLHFKGTKSSLLNGPSSDYPEVVID